MDDLKTSLHAKVLRLTEPRSGAGLETGAFTAEAGLARLVTVKLVVGQFARVRATPSLGGEAAQHTRPALALDS